VPRAPRFTDDDVLDAARDVVARQGRRVTIADVADELGGPVGSIYHRFDSRDELLARLWLRSVARFQRGLFELAEAGRATGDAHRTLVELALHVPRYCRDHVAEGRALTLHRQSQLLRDCPEGLREVVATVNDELDALTVDLTRWRFGSATPELVELVITACRTSPYGLVRPHLGRDVPALVDATTAAATDAILRLGDGGGFAEGGRTGSPPGHGHS
jgi:AcrR family transcriptional regulator